MLNPVETNLLPALNVAIQLDYWLCDVFLVDRMKILL